MNAEIATLIAAGFGTVFLMPLPLLVVIVFVKKLV